MHKQLSLEILFLNFCFAVQLGRYQISIFPGDCIKYLMDKDEGCKFVWVSSNHSRYDNLLFDLLKKSFQPHCAYVQASSLFIQVLLLDEITVDLDVLARADLLRFLRKECDEMGATIIYATHIFDGLEDWPTNIVRLCSILNTFYVNVLAQSFIILNVLFIRFMQPMGSCNQQCLWTKSEISKLSLMVSAIHYFET